MKNFGKFTRHHEQIEISDNLGSSQYYDVVILRDENGEDIVDVIKRQTHKYYIAVTVGGIIISMTDDIEQSQISDHDIIGIDHDYGFTFGPGGTVYGMVWTGDAIVSPESLLTDDERREQMQPLARADFRLRLKKAAITTTVINAAIAAVADEELREDYEIIWEDGQSFGRLDPLVLAIFEYAGKTPEQADSIWSGE